MVTAPFIEQDCTITHEDKSFTSGGSWLAERADKPGTWAGVVYVNPIDNDRSVTYQGIQGRCVSNVIIPCRGTVTTWHGEHIADAQFGARYRGNYCRMRTVSFTYAGINFHGRYCPDTSQAVRVTGRKAKVK